MNALHSSYLSPDDPDEERRIFDLLDPEYVPQSIDPTHANKEAKLLASENYADQQDLHDESSASPIGQIKDLSPENQAKVEELINRLLDEEHKQFG